jgi:hypothetical protein
MLHIYTIHRAGGGAQAAADTPFGAVIVPGEIMQAAVPIFKLRFLLRILLGNRLPEQIPEGNGKPPGNGQENRF